MQTIEYILTWHSKYEQTIKYYNETDEIFYNVDNDHVGSACHFCR